MWGLEEEVVISEGGWREMRMWRMVGSRAEAVLNQRFLQVQVI